jgi:hypothetical protein
MSQSEVGSVAALDEYGKFASDLEGYVIAPIPLDQYVPKVESNIYQYREIFPHRAGSKPLTTRHEPHQQITQHGKAELWDELLARCATLPDVTVMDESLVSVPGARGLWLNEDVPKGPEDAFHLEREFAHVHTRPDASIHLQLPLELAAVAMGAGWAEPHTYLWRGLCGPNSLMIYAARTPQELDVIWMLFQEAYRYSRNEPTQFTITPTPK